MRLVAPTYTFDPTAERIIEFKGLNRKTVVEDGEMRDMKNLSSDEYPCLTQRMTRDVFMDAKDYASWSAMNLVHPVKALPKARMENGVSLEKLAVIDLVEDDYVFKYDGASYPGLVLSAETQMVAINTRICFFPEKKWFNVETQQYGSLDASLTVTGSVSLTTNSEGQVLTFTSTDLSDFKADDAVNLYCTLTVAGHTYDFTSVPVACLIQKIATNKITIPDGTFLHLAQNGATTGTLTNVKIERPCPDLAYVMESNNRLWGVDNLHNEIRASKQGDPTNWQYYQGSSLDSYAATQGTDGEWTGCAAYSGHLIFFKQNCMHKVYGTKPAAYQISTATCYGLEKGSSASVQVINDTVFYKSAKGIMAYSGGEPVNVSEKFGDDRLRNVVAGTDGKKYYMSAQKANGDYTYRVFDLDNTVWHVEDELKADAFCYYKGKMLILADGEVYQPDSTEDYVWNCETTPYERTVLNDLFDTSDLTDTWTYDDFTVAEIEALNAEYEMTEPTDSTDPMYTYEEYVHTCILLVIPYGSESRYANIEWVAEFGPFHEYMEDKKIYSKMKMRLVMEDKSVLRVYMKIDGGEWELVRAVEADGETALYLPIIPRRCDRFSIRLEGKGKTRVESLARRYRAGTDGRDVN